MTATRTPIAIIRDHLEDWRRDNRWSRETLAAQIVDAHERHGFDRLIGLDFDPPTRDTFERMRVNADRIFRWLDDSTKDKNLLSANLLWSVMAALPLPRRLALAADLLAPIGLVAELDEGATAELDELEISHHIQEVVQASAEVTVALVAVSTDQPQACPDAAMKKLSRLRAVGAACKRLLTGLRLRKGAKQGVKS